jgi:S1-C subfamily serine protease
MRPVVRSWMLLLIGGILFAAGMFWVRARQHSGGPEDLLLEAQGSLARSFGMEVATEAIPEGGVRVEEVRPGSPAERAGIKAGDRIVACGDRSVWHAYQLAQYIGEELAFGPAVTLLVESGGDYRPAMFGMQPRAPGGR